MPPAARPRFSSVVTTAAATDTPPATAVPEAEPVTTSLVLRLGLYALCTYLISGYATDLSYRFLGTKPYVSMVSGVVVFVCFVLSGRAAAALRTNVGRLWLGLGLWMCVSIAFSRWRGGSFEVMQMYLPKQHMVLFYIAAFALTVKDCRTVLRACILGSFVLLITCFFFGAPEQASGRFVINSNPLLNNPNDLAMQLVMALGFFLFWIRQPGLMGRVGGMLGMFGAAYYLLKTGSRGGMLAAAALTLLWVFFSRNRFLIIALAIPAIGILSVMTPQANLHRLSLIFLHPDEELVTSVEEEKTVSSQMARTYLMKKSVEIALANPIFGVGPGCFSDALEAEGKKEGRHEASVGTHNTYTQIAAECGMPALIMFVAAIIIAIRSSYRLYRQTSKDPSQDLLSSVAFTCFGLTVAYSIDVFFHHMAYYGSMPLFLGLWVATDLATRQARLRRAVTA